MNRRRVNVVAPARQFHRYLASDVHDCRKKNPSRTWKRVGNNKFLFVAIRLLMEICNSHLTFFLECGNKIPVAVVTKGKVTLLSENSLNYLRLFCTERKKNRWVNNNIAAWPLDLETWKTWKSHEIPTNLENSWIFLESQGKV